MPPFEYLDFHYQLPPELADELSIPSKWLPGTPCPNCLGDDSHECQGTLLLLDNGDETGGPSGVHEWGGDHTARYEIVCDCWVDDGPCTFHPYSVDNTISATVPEDYEETY